MKRPVPLPERRFFAGIAVGVLVGVLGVGAVTAASPTPSSSTAVGTTGSATASAETPAASAGTAVKPGGRPAAAGTGVRLGALRKAIAGDFRVAVTATNAKGTHDILYVRGSLAVSATAVTVTLPDNSTQSFTVDSTTVVRDKGATIAFSDLANGERAMVFGTKNSDGSYTAKLIRCVKGAKAAAAGPTGSAAP